MGGLGTYHTSGWVEYLPYQWVGWVLTIPVGGLGTYHTSGWVEYLPYQCVGWELTIPMGGLSTCHTSGWIGYLPYQWVGWELTNHTSRWVGYLPYQLVGLVITIPVDRCGYLPYQWVGWVYFEAIQKGGKSDPIDFQNGHLACNSSNFCLLRQSCSILMCLPSKKFIKVCLLQNAPNFLK